MRDAARGRICRPSKIRHVPAGAQITQVRSDYFPIVEAVAGYNAIGTGLPAANNFNAGIVITWPIFNGFETEHQVPKRRPSRSHSPSIADLQQRV